MPLQLLTADRPQPAIARCEWQGRAAFVKQVRPRRWYKRMQLPFFAPFLRYAFAPRIPFTPFVRAKHLPVEVQRLRELRQAGWRVPEVFAADMRQFVMEDVGPTLEHYLNDHWSADEQLHWLCTAAQDLGKFHSAGHWHGGAQVRNLILAADNMLVRIDFETDYDCYLPLPLLQALDILLFISSAARYTVTSGLAVIVHAYAERRVDDTVQGVLRRMRVTIERLAYLPLFSRVAPKEHRRLLAIASVLPELCGGE